MGRERVVAGPRPVRVDRGDGDAPCPLRARGHLAGFGGRLARGGQVDRVEDRAGQIPVADRHDPALAVDPDVAEVEPALGGRRVDAARRGSS